MKKTLYTLAVNDYAPQITAITFPLLKNWANKIGAEFFVIKDRKYPDLPPVYEKFQIYDLSKEHDNDWNIFLDADTLVHPDMFDVTAILSKDFTSSGFVSDFSPIRFKPDKYFLRDGRFIGKGNWCLIASDWCTDIWLPLHLQGMIFEEVIKDISPTCSESNTVIKKEHLIDDYLVSHNIARFGLKHILISELEAARRIPSGHLWHEYRVDMKQKVNMMYKQVAVWMAQGLVDGRLIDSNAVNQFLDQWKGQTSFGEFLDAGMDMGKRIKECICKLGIEL